MKQKSVPILIVTTFLSLFIFNNSPAAIVNLEPETWFRIGSEGQEPVIEPTNLQFRGYWEYDMSPLENAVEILGAYIYFQVNEASGTAGSTLSYYVGSYQPDGLIGPDDWYNIEPGPDGILDWETRATMEPFGGDGIREERVWVKGAVRTAFENDYGSLGIGIRKDLHGSLRIRPLARIEVEYEMVPIPSTAWLLASGLVGLVGLRKRLKS